MDTSNSEFFHFGILPRECVHTPEEDDYSKMYKPQEICECGCKDWIERGCTMILAHYIDGTPIYKDVHRCSNCFTVRMSRHIGKK